MWLFTSIGFFSVVAVHDSPDALVIRARRREALAALRDTVLPDLAVLETTGRDYRWRALAARDEWVHAASELAARR